MERIIIDPKIMHEKPVIKGTRVPVDVILGSLISGMSYEEIEREYGIEKEDILELGARKFPKNRIIH